MKRFTLFAMLVAVLSVTAFAQKRALPLPLRHHARAAKTVLSTPSTPFNHVRRAPSATPVTPPEELDIIEYIYQGMDDEQKQLTGYMYAAFSGTDVYLQGLCPFLPSAWVKGTLADGKVTIPGGSYFGVFTYDKVDYDMYLNYGEEDVVFQYGEETGFELVNEIIEINNEETFGNDQYYDAYTALSLQKVVEMAAVPQTPEIVDIAESDSYGWYMDFDIPLYDVNNKPMSSSKLYYVIYVREGNEVRQLEFTPETHERLPESMTIFPYGFTEEWDFYVDELYFNDLWSDDWEAIGIQSIYKGGDVDNESEICWYSTEFPGFNFNKMDVATSNTSSDGDITEDLTLYSSKGTLTITPSGAQTNNRFWSTANGPQLRVYGGTLTFTAPYGAFITGLEFNYAKWNDGNDFNSGDFDVDTNEKVVLWEGSAQSVVLTIAANTQFNSIKVYLGAPEALEVPEDLEATMWTWTGQAVTMTGGEEGTEKEPFTSSVYVGFYGDGSEVYIQGLNPYVPDAWVKGTLADGKVTIPAGTFAGTYEYIDWETYQYVTSYLYLTAADGLEDATLEDIVFNYDAEANTLTSSQNIFVCENPDILETSFWYWFTDNQMTFIPDVAATPAAPSVADCNLSGFYPYVKFDIPATDTEGNPLITDKLYYVIWVRTENGEPEKLTLSTADYEELEVDMTEIPYGYDDDWDIYAGGSSVYLNQDDETLASWKYIGVQSIYYGAGEEHASEIGWFELTIDGIGSVEAGAKNGNPVIYNLSGQRVQKPQRGLYIIDGRKVVVRK